MQPEKITAKSLIQGKKTLAIAESCTGGLLTHSLTNIPGATQFFKSAVIAYSNETKIVHLGVPEKVIRRCGAVSKETVHFLAKNVRKIFKSDYGIGVSGIAGPSGGTSLKPVGLVYIGIASKSKVACYRRIFKGTRLQIKKQATIQALLLFNKFLRTEGLR